MAAAITSTMANATTAMRRRPGVTVSPYGPDAEWVCHHGRVVRRLIVLAVLVGVVAAGVVWLRGGVGDDVVQARVMTKVGPDKSLATVQDVVEQVTDVTKAKKAKAKKAQAKESAGAEADP